MSKISDASALINALTDGAITSLDDFINKRTGGNNGNPETRYWARQARVAGATMPALVSGQWSSLWLNEGIPSHGAAPGAWANPTNATAGSLRQTDPSGGRSRWITSLSVANAMTAGTILIYDRLGHCSGLSGTATGAQNVNGGSVAPITRYTTGEHNFLWLEIYAAIGTAQTFTCSYTNESGVLHTSQPNKIGNASRQEVARILPVSLALGDYGVRDVTSVTLSASTTVVGDFGLTIARPLMTIAYSVLNNAPVITCFFDGPISKVLTGACLASAILPQAGGAANPLEMMIETVEA